MKSDEAANLRHAVDRYSTRVELALGMFIWHAGWLSVPSDFWLRRFDWSPAWLFQWDFFWMLATFAWLVAALFIGKFINAMFWTGLHYPGR